MKGVVRSGIIIILFIALIQVTSAAGEELYFIDAHSQVDHQVVPLNKVIFLMKQGGVSLRSCLLVGNSKEMLSEHSHRSTLNTSHQP